MIKWPSDLVSDLSRRRCVLVLGSGISANSRNSTGDSPQTWHSFLTEGSRSLRNNAKNTVMKLVKSGDLLTACQVLREQMGIPAFHDYTQSAFLRPGFQPAEIHDRIIELDSRIVATPNFDNIYENRVNAVQGSTVSVKHYYDNDIAECIRGTQRFVLKIHGTVHTPNKMIFTRDDYARARNKYSSFYEILKSLIITHTFVFLGCGIEDPDIRLLLEDYGFRHEFSRPHYFVVNNGKISRVAKEAIEKSLNVRFLEYPAQKGDHSRLVESIASLRDLVNEKRLEISKSFDW